MELKDYITKLELQIRQLKSMTMFSTDSEAELRRR
jgi:hypothetical protein